MLSVVIIASALPRRMFTLKVCYDMKKWLLVYCSGKPEVVPYCSSCLHFVKVYKSLPHSEMRFIFCTENQLCYCRTPKSVSSSADRMSLSLCHGRIQGQSNPCVIVATSASATALSILRICMYTQLIAWGEIADVPTKRQTLVYQCFFSSRNVGYITPKN